MANRIFILLLSLASLLGCGKSKEETPLPTSGKSNPLERMSLEERQNLAPNELFQAIYENDLAKVQSVIETSPHLIGEQNSELKELPLATAIRLRYKDIAVYLAETTPLKMLTLPNAQNESLMFLASRFGLPEVITKMGERSFHNHSIQLVYGVDDLDYPDLLGRKALHVAANRLVVEALAQEHTRGYMKIPYLGLYIYEDHQHQNFLHSAAAEGRSDVLLWATENFCGEELKDNENPLASAVGHLTLWPTRTFQTYFPWKTSIMDHPINYLDSQQRSPLHYAAEKAHLESILALGSCQWIDYDRADKEGNLAINLFLQSLDPQQKEIPEKQRDILRFFLSHHTFMRKIFVNTGTYINAANHQGNSSLHYAALLADPWPYQEMRIQGGDIFLRNKDGQRPVDLFEQKQKQIRGQE